MIILLKLNLLFYGILIYVRYTRAASYVYECVQSICSELN